MGIVIFRVKMSTPNIIHHINTPSPVGPGSNRAVALCSRPQKQVFSRRPLEDGNKQRNSDQVMGVVLRAIVKSLLMTGGYWTKQAVAHGSLTVL